MIRIDELKNQIEHNEVKDNLIIFKCDKVNSFIPHQYAIEFCKKNDCEVVHLDSVSDFPTNNLFSVPSENLHIYKVDSLDCELPVSQLGSSKVWVVCNKITAKVKKAYADSIVEVPKIQEWQVKDFISTYCKGLSQRQVDELFDYYHNDLYRLENELDKIKTYGVANYDIMSEQLYADVSNFSIFDLTNSIIRRDVATLSRVLEDIDHIDVEPFGLITLLTNNFKNVIDVQLGKNATAESLGISGKQFWAIKNYSCGYYTKKELVSILKFLSGLDYMVKSGKIDTSMLVDYIICKVITV